MWVIRSSIRMARRAGCVRSSGPRGSSSTSHIGQFRRPACDRIFERELALVDQAHRRRHRDRFGHRRDAKQRVSLHRQPRVDVPVADLVDLQHSPRCQTTVTAPASRPASHTSRMEAWLPSRFIWFRLAAGLRGPADAPGGGFHWREGGVCTVCTACCRTDTHVRRHEASGGLNFMTVSVEQSYGRLPAMRRPYIACLALMLAAMAGLNNYVKLWRTALHVTCRR